MTTTTTKVENLLSVAQVARRINRSAALVRVEADSGRLPAIRTSIGRLFRPEDVNEYLRQRAVRLGPRANEGEVADGQEG
jgi:hypothetical protein